MGKYQARYIAIAAILILGVFVTLVLMSHSYNAEVFTLSGTQFRLADAQGTKGYDGQFAYYMAIDPHSAYRNMDEPGKRYQRILFPILAWLLSLGGIPSIVPWVMIGINLAAVTITTSLLAIMLSERGANPWFALTYLFYIGVLFSIRADLNEPLAMLLCLVGWYAYQKRLTWQAILLFALGGLAKEIALIFPFAIAAWELISARWRKGLSILCFSFLPFSALFLVLQKIWGNSTASLLPLWLPFSGVAVLQDRAFLFVEGLWVLFPIGILMIFLIKDLLDRNRKHWNLETFMLLINVACLSIMPYQTWEDPLAVLRSALPFLLAAIIWMAQNHKRILPYAAALWGTSCIMLFLIPGMVF